MEDTKEKISSLDSEDEDKVSGGFYETGFFDTYTRCDKCGAYGAYPCNGGHLCEACLKRYKEIIGK